MMGDDYPLEVPIPIRQPGTAPTSLLTPPPLSDPHGRVKAAWRRQKEEAEAAFLDEQRQ
jgi:hypothetical protein